MLIHVSIFAEGAVLVELYWLIFILSYFNGSTSSIDEIKKQNKLTFGDSPFGITVIR